jgi:hypothetical protein
MTLLDITIEDKIYTIELALIDRIKITRNMMQLYIDFCAVHPEKQIGFEEYLSIIGGQPHPENQAADEDIEEDVDDVIATLCEQVRRKDVMIDALLEAIGKMK